MPIPFLKSLVGVAATSPAAPEVELTAYERLRGGGQPVGDSEDLRRILALPRRPKPSDGEISAWAAELKSLFGLVVKPKPDGSPGCECRSRFNRPCCDQLKPVQAWALAEGATVGGILGPIGVGHGKTLLDLLMPMVVHKAFGLKTTLLLLPPNLKRQFLDVDWHYYGQHWQLPNRTGRDGGRWLVPGRPTLHVVAFSELSGSRATDLLQRLQPDCVVVDEAHSVRNRNAARTKRFLRYFQKPPAHVGVNGKPLLFCWSGTLTSRSIRDYAHLSDHSLGQGSPVPRHWAALEQWASALDPSESPAPPGRLAELGLPLRDGFQRRLVESAGVISSGDTASCQASLVISERSLPSRKDAINGVPLVVTEALKALEATWQRPDGEELVDALTKARTARELSCGFYYRWRWPRGEPVAVIEEWLRVRKEWHKELREKLKKGGAHMDSPLLVTKAAIRWEEGYWHVERDRNDVELRRVRVEPRTRGGPLPTWQSEWWSRWREVRETAKPETEAVWLSDFLVEDSLAWLAEGPGLLWYEFDGFARRLHQRSRERNLRVVLAGPGDDGNARVLALDGSEPVVASIRAHGTGKNLQQFARNLVANPPSDGATWEQLIGRTFRQGQAADEVTFDVYQHTEAFRSAVSRARDLSEYIEGTFGTNQKLVSIATWTF